MDDDRDARGRRCGAPLPQRGGVLGRGRSRETVERLVRESTRVIAAYDGAALVGFCRVVSDGSNMAWLGDVFVLPEHRGRGVGTELVREAVEHPDAPRPAVVPRHAGRPRRCTRSSASRPPNERARWSRPADRGPSKRSGRGPRRVSRRAARGRRSPTSSTHSGCDAIRTRAPTSPCRWPASA